MSNARRKISFQLNGATVSATVENHHNVVELLEQFGLRGARESCGQGLCGCCTILIDDVAVSGCLQLAAMVDGKNVCTIEGMQKNGELDPIQQAFIESGAFQCGFCTPGFVLMTQQLLDRYPDPDDDQIRSYLSGNLCRCGAYPEILKAVRLAAEKRKSAATA